MTDKQKQHLLAYLGYYVGTVDGVLGSGSREAIKAFQRDFFQMESKVDGICGTETEKALTHAIAYGMPAKKVENFPNKEKTGTFWDDIKYFTRGEPGIACPCGRCSGFPVEPSEKLMRLADKVREHFGAPMTPSSTVRCQAHNDELPGSAPNSYHVKGKAMDFSVRGFSAGTILAYVQSQGVHYAYAINGSYVHMDVE